MNFAPSADTMTRAPNASMAEPKSVTALFDSRDNAETARQDLIHAGVPADEISITGTEALAPADAAALEEVGFWDSLKHLFMLDEDRYAYAEGVRRGGYTVAVRTDAAAYTAVIDILDRDGAVDMAEREAEWREAGWAAWPGAASELSYSDPGNATAGFAANSAADPFPSHPTAPEAVAPLPDGTATATLSGRSATALAEHPVSSAPPIPSPGVVGDLIASGTPDRAYAAAAPGAVPGQVSGAAPEIEMPRATTLADVTPDWTSGAPLPRRDTSHGRVRIRSYVSDSTSVAPPDRDRA